MPDAPAYNPKSVTLLAATGETIFYLVSAKNMLIDHKLGTDDDSNWFTDKYGNISNVMLPVVGIYDTYVNLPSTASLQIGDYALVTADHTLHRVLDSSGSNVWTASNKGVSIDGNRLFLNKGDSDKIVRWDGTAFSQIAGSSDGGSNEFIGAPVIFANRIQSQTNGSPGRTKSYIYQTATANPHIVHSVYDSSTQQWLWDTEHAVDVSSIYGSAWYDALYIETDTGRMWTVSSSDNHLQPVTMGTYTKLVVMTETCGGSGWEYAVSGSTSAPTPAANGRCLIMTTETSSSTGVTTVVPLWCLAVSDGQGGYLWDTEHPVSADSDFSSSYIYYAEATGRLYMYVDGNTTLTFIARPGTGGSGTSNIELEDVQTLSNTQYPNPTSWQPSV